MLDCREVDFRRTSDAHAHACHELCCARDELAKLQEEQVNLQRALDLKMQDKADLARRADAELCKNRSLTATLCGLEAKIRTTEENLCVSRREHEDLRFSNAGLQGRNADLRAEIEALQHHCHVLQSQNKDLNCELERFVATDEQIRMTLNRRDRVETLRYTTDAEVCKSRQNLDRASPRRK